MSSQAVVVINGINMVVSIGLLALGIVLVIYGFRINDKKCDQDSNGSYTGAKNCFVASNIDGNGSAKDTSENVETLRLVALITGFLLIIPFGLNLAEMMLTYVPGTGGVGGFIGKIGGAANQKAYTMRSRHHMRY